MEGQAMSKEPTDIILELRTLSRLIETKAPATFGEQDVAHLRAAADEIEVLRKAVVAEREEILELIHSHRADSHMYDGDYALRRVAGAIQARITISDKDE
jgi:hypothetical protein